MTSATQAAIFFANSLDIADFLTAAIDSLVAIGRPLTDSEQSGFCLCISALKLNLRGAYEARSQMHKKEAPNA